MTINLVYIKIYDYIVYCKGVNRRHETNGNDYILVLILPPAYHN